MQNSKTLADTGYLKTNCSKRLSEFSCVATNAAGAADFDINVKVIGLFQKSIKSIVLF